MSLWGVASLACMQNVGAWRMLGECSRKFHLKILSLGPPWYWDTWNAAKDRRQWNYFDKCNRKVCTQALLLLWGCWMHVPAWLRLKRAGVLISRLFIVDGFRCFVCNSLVDMYAKGGSIEEAWRVFNKMPFWNVITWNAMILGHVKWGDGQKVLELFWQMQQEGVCPSPVTFVWVLNACASVVVTEEGRCVHQHIIDCGYNSNVFVTNSLVDMYAKCGTIEDAWRVFNKIPSWNFATWNAILKGCAMHGLGEEALKHFEQMQEDGVQPKSYHFYLSSVILEPCRSSGWRDALFCFDEHSLWDFYKIGTLHLYCSPSWPC